MLSLSDLIPVWCEGIDPAYWRTEQGLRYALVFWAQYGHEATTATKAARLIFKLPDKAIPSRNQYKHMYARFDRYPVPYTLIYSIRRHFMPHLTFVRYSEVVDFMKCGAVDFEYGSLAR